VINVADDPVELGLVASLSRPGGNATGVSFLFSDLVAKHLGLLRELLPKAARFGLLVNPQNANAENLIAQAASAGGLFHYSPVLVFSPSNGNCNVSSNLGFTRSSLVMKSS
jgi:putative ABC transport system substrate-binding protein